MKSVLLRPDVSVILRAYEQPLTLRLGLQCLLAQETDASYEIIVCDDGSSPDCFESCRDLMRSARQRVRWVWQPDRGFNVASSSNNGLRLATGELVIIMDGDMIPPRDFLQKHIDAHRTPGLIVAGARLWRPLPLLETAETDSTEALWAWLEDEASVDVSSRFSQEFERKVREPLFAKGKGWMVALTCNLSAPSSEELFFDDNFHGWGCEDAELAYRLEAKAGLKLTYAREIVAFHLQGEVWSPSQSRRHDDIAAYLRNLCYFQDKWPEAIAQYPPESLPFELDKETNTWKVWRSMRRSDPLALLAQAREWLAENGIYPANEA